MPENEMPKNEIAEQEMENPERDSATVATLILSKEKFKKLDDARKWVIDHDYKAGKVDETETSFRFRQIDPGRFKDGSMKTMELGDGISAVVGRLKE